MSDQTQTHAFSLGDDKLTMLSDGRFPVTADIFPAVNDTRLQGALADINPDQVATNGLQIAAMHLQHPRLGRVEQAGPGYRYPACA